MKELKRYNISVAAIQETKWFGQDIWTAEGYTFLHSGRPLPISQEDQSIRNEGVGIALNRAATRAWQDAGEQWQAVSSRIVTARLKVACKGKRKPGGSREPSDTFMTIISAYAPTAKATPSTKQGFSNNLQTALNSVPHTDILVMLGDFNARVGRRDRNSELWEKVLGFHGLEERNLAGEEFLEFCTINNLSIMNTWFQKKPIFLGTWMHPATKKYHMIDYVVMRTCQSKLCCDVQVMRGANCWSDHQMLRAKLTLRLPHSIKKHQDKATPFAIYKLHSSMVRESYSDSLSTSLNSIPAYSRSSSEAKWDILKKCILDTAEESIGRERKFQPDWFLESSSTLTPVIEAKNKAYEKVLQTDHPTNRQEFRRQQRLVKSTVDKAKEQWIMRISKEGELAARDGKTRWSCIKKLQMLHKGRRPRRPTSVLKENGEMTKDPEEIKNRWHRHFTSILNASSHFAEETISMMPQRTTLWELDAVPTEEELQTAMSKLKTEKAAGLTGILPEMILFGGMELKKRLLDLMQTIWEEGTVVEEWRNAQIIPIPKKGDLKVCDNWRGISLLDVVGKIFARIIQDRLQTIAEDFLPESQCGFRKGRGCIDMIFTARQLVEKSIEHTEPLYSLFIDLKKAYDSIPRSALWSVLEKVGIPPKMLNIITSLHNGMVAVVRIGTSTTDKISVHNGLRQGCTLAPTLFNIYYSTMINHWRNQCGSAGVDVRFKIG